MAKNTAVNPHPGHQYIYVPMRSIKKLAKCDGAILYARRKNTDCLHYIASIFMDFHRQCQIIYLEFSVT